MGARRPIELISGGGGLAEALAPFAFTHLTADNDDLLSSWQWCGLSCFSRYNYLKRAVGLLPLCVHQERGAPVALNAKASAILRNYAANRYKPTQNGLIPFQHPGKNEKWI